MGNKDVKIEYRSKQQGRTREIIETLMKGNAQKEARIRELEDLLDYVYLHIEKAKGDTLGAIAYQNANIQLNICAVLDRTPEENDLWQNKSNQEDE